MNLTGIQEENSRETQIVKITGKEITHENHQQTFGSWKMNRGFALAGKTEYQKLQGRLIRRREVHQSIS